MPVLQNTAPSRFAADARKHAELATRFTLVATVGVVVVAGTGYCQCELATGILRYRWSGSGSWYWLLPLRTGCWYTAVAYAMRLRSTYGLYSPL
eukprot:6202347-Pleurochrysis_carterae.AAC.2